MQTQTATTVKPAAVRPSYQLYPIGYVRREEAAIYLDILEPYRPALKQLDQFSHVLVFWWAEGHDNPESRQIMQTDLPYAEGEVAGVFACRAEYRPNPIAMTVCELVAVDEATGRVRLTNIDAYDNTPLLDIKAYIPVCDRVEEIRSPEWFAGWPQSLPSMGMGLWEEEA